VRGLFKDQPWLSTIFATLVAALAVILIAHATGADAIGKAFDDVDPIWIVLVAGAELITYPAYVVAYRAVAVIHGHAPLSLPIVSRIVVAGFGPFALDGGFGVDKRMLEAIDEDDRSARVRVMALGVFEWAILAPTACITAIVLLAEHADIMPSLLWPWALTVPPAGVLAVWMSTPRRSQWIAERGGRRLELLVQMLEGIYGVRCMVTQDPLRKVGAWFGITLYWAADIAAFWGALQTFGIDLGIGKLIIAYATGYAATRRSLPLGGAGATEALMTYALYWVREPLAPALAAVMLYRLFNFLLIAAPAVIAHRQLPNMISRARAASLRAAARRPTRPPS
jgi:uncharacterized membrane protein YbhN (UPF0104 family)